MLLLMLRGWVPPDGAWGIDPRWIYGLSVLVVGGMLIAWRQEYGELARQTLPDARECAVGHRHRTRRLRAVDPGSTRHG